MPKSFFGLPARAGVCSLRGSAASMARVARYTLAYYAVCTAAAVALGVLLVNLIQPGRGHPLAGSALSSCRSAGLPVHWACFLKNHSPLPAYMPADPRERLSADRAYHHQAPCSGKRSRQHCHGKVLEPWEGKACPWAEENSSLHAVIDSQCVTGQGGGPAAEWVASPSAAGHRAAGPPRQCCGGSSGHEHPGHHHVFPLLRHLPRLPGGAGRRADPPGQCARLRSCLRGKCMSEMCLVRTCSCFFAITPLV